MEVKWIKIVTDVFSDEKIMLMETLPEGDAVIAIWFKLLCLAGKSNRNGFLMMSDTIAYTDEMLATIFRKSLTIVQIAMRYFVQFEMIEIIENAYRISNWEKHQNVEGLDKIREQTRKRVSDYREKNKQLQPPQECNVTSNATVTHGNGTEVELEEEVERDIIPYTEIQNEWNNHKNLPQIMKMTVKRKDKLKVRWKQFKSIDPFKESFSLISQSDFCTGQNNKGWKVDFDWVIKNEENMVKVLEGKYKNKIGQKNNGFNNFKQTDDGMNGMSEKEFEQHLKEINGLE